MVPMDSLRRPQLDAIATELGVEEPGNFANKDAIIEEMVSNYESDQINAAMEKILVTDADADADAEQENQQGLTYNGIPVTILKDLGDGTLRIRYNRSGEVRRVQSDALE